MRAPTDVHRWWACTLARWARRGMQARWSSPPHIRACKATGAANADLGAGAGALATGGSREGTLSGEHLAVIRPSYDDFPPSPAACVQARRIAEATRMQLFQESVLRLEKSMEVRGGSGRRGARTSNAIGCPHRPLFSLARLCKCSQQWRVRRSVLACTLYHQAP